MVLGLKFCALASAVLSAVAANPAAAPEEDYLGIVDAFLRRQTRQTFLPNDVGLMQTYGSMSLGGGPCGSNCTLPAPCSDGAGPNRCRYDVYDNAVAAIYLTHRGLLGEAQRILDAFVYFLYPPEQVPNSYGPVGMPSERRVALLAAAYSAARAQPGNYSGPGIMDGAVDTGNNAWAGIALARYAAKTGLAHYWIAARDILHVLRTNTVCEDHLGGFMSRLAPEEMYYRSTEHNVDMYAFASMLADEEAREHANRFVSSMFGRYPNHNAYATGTGTVGRCNASVPPSAVAADAQFWNLAARSHEEIGRASLSVDFALGATGLWAEDVDRMGNTAGVGRGSHLFGFRFTTNGNGVQWENTASGVIGLLRFHSLYGNESLTPPHVHLARDSLKHLLRMYACVPASVLGGNWNKFELNGWGWGRSSQPVYDLYPGGSDTGLGWTYLRYPHVASTAWTGLMLLYQGDESQPIDDGANPYSVPAPNVRSRVGEASDGIIVFFM